jgi:DnaJ homolog subfamily B member 12
MHMRHGGGPQEMSPEEIFNAFFGGGMPGGGGVHFYSTGFGPGGVQFRTGGGQRRQQRAQQQNAEQQAGFGMLFQMLPILLFVLLSFLSQNDSSQSATTGEGQYFSLVVSF